MEVSWLATTLVLCFWLRLRQINSRRPMKVAKNIGGDWAEANYPWIVRRGRNTLRSLRGGKAPVKKFFTEITDAFTNRFGPTRFSGLRR